MSKDEINHVYTDYVESRRISNIDGMFKQRFGEKYTEYRRKWDNASRLNPEPYPVHIDFEFVDDCNLRCKMCPRNDEVHEQVSISVGTKKTLDFNLFKSIIDESEEYKLRAINLGAAAEVLLRKHELPRFISYAKSKGVIDIWIVTNGLLLDPSIMEELIHSGLTRLAVSIDAINKETYKKIRNANIERVVENLIKSLEVRKRLNSFFPVVRVSFAEMEENRDEKEVFFNFWKDKVDYIDFQGFINYYNKDYSKDFKCNEAWRRLMVWADGTVSPCCSFYGKNLIVGDATTQSIKDIWNGHKIKELRKNLINKNFPISCRKCYGSRDSVNNKAATFAL